MATRSAAKAHAQSLKRRLRNRAVRSATKSAMKHAVERVASGDPDAARDAVRAAISALDRAAHKGVLHPNSVARRKSRLLLKYNAAIAALQALAERPRPRKARTTGRSSSRSSAAPGRKRVKK